MFRIDSPGATVDNRFTEGDPSLSVPATVVSADFMNHVQEEIIKLIEEMGIAPDKGNEGQHYSALLEFALRGGRKSSFNSNIANNTANADVLDLNNASAEFIVDRTKIKMLHCIVDIERKTDTEVVREYGDLLIAYNSKDNTFEVPRFRSVNGDAGVNFTLAQVAATDEFKLQYTSDDLPGTSYVGRVDITSIVEIKQ